MGGGYRDRLSYKTREIMAVKKKARLRTILARKKLGKTKLTKSRLKKKKLKELDYE
jgi:hypothetical protein